MARSWADGSLLDLSSPPNWILSDSNIVVIADKFPKAKYHYLVVPRQKIASIFELTKSHFDLLDEMYLMALKVIAMQGKKPKDFIIGYHAESSVNRLLLHVISTDFISSSLRTQSQWNSFNTPLFILHDELLRCIRMDGKISKLDPILVQTLYDTPLKCHRCGAKPCNMRALKLHLRVHSN